MNKSKELIFSAIRHNRPEGEYPYPGIPAFSKSTQNILAEFKESLIAGAGEWYEVSGIEEAAQKIKELHPDARVICSATDEIKGNIDLSQVKDPHQLHDVDVGIIKAQFGVAETGMVWVTEQDMKVTSLGFLAQHMIILLNPHKLVRDMYEAYSFIDLERDNYGCFMLGPSGTADIGATMVHGAQGPRTLTVLFM